MFTPKLTASEIVSIIVGAQPGTAVYHSINKGWTTTDHLLATMSEYQAGLVSLPQRFSRPGVADVRPGKMPDIRDPNTNRLAFDSMTIDEFEARRKARLKGA